MYEDHEDHAVPNDITVLYRHPTPHIQIIKSNLNAARVFTKVKLKLACHEILIIRADTLEAGATTNFGPYKFLVMLFGLHNASQAFHRFIDCTTIS